MGNKQHKEDGFYNFVLFSLPTSGNRVMVIVRILQIKSSRRRHCHRTRVYARIRWRATYTRLNIYQRRWTTERQRRPRHIMSIVIGSGGVRGVTAVAAAVTGAHRSRRPPKSGPRDDCRPVPWRRPAAAAAVTASVLFVPGQQQRQQPTSAMRFSFFVFLNAAARNKKHVIFMKLMLLYPLHTRDTNYY